MIDKICKFLTNKIQKNVPDVDEEKAEIINYGLQNIIGEIPKTFVLLAIAYLLGIWQLAIVAFLVVQPYRTFSGGFHLSTHMGCIIGTSLVYFGNVLLSKYIVLDPIYIKYLVIAGVWIFSLIMIKKYAPADTENVPILRKKDRKRDQILAYITVTISLLIALFIQNSVISNIIILGMFIQTVTITRLAYKITKNKYGYEVYNEEAA